MTTDLPAAAQDRPWRDPTVLTAVLLNLAVFAYALLAAHTDPGALDRLLVEDGLLEWLQFLAFGLLSGVLALVAIERGARPGGAGRDVLVIGGLSVVVALAALEEVSWFQRVLDFDSPAFFRSHNRQGETNLHNMAVAGSSVNKLILVRLIILVAIVHNLVLPILARHSARLRRWVGDWGLYIPPLSAAVPFLVLTLLSHLAIDHARVGELGEAFAAVHYLATAAAAYGLGMGHAAAGAFTCAPDRRRASVLFAALLLGLVFVAWLLAAAYGR